MSGVGHDHTGHTHASGGGHGHAASQTRVFWTFWLIAIFMVLEAAGGWWAHSLTLVADAGHMLTDAGALALAWFAARAMQRPSDAKRSYGHDRFSVLAALVNGLALLAIVVWIAFEAIQRMMAPETVKAIPMLAIALAGLAVNSVAFFLLHGGDRDNLNVQAALLHVIGDILASVAAVIAALIILFKPGLTIADPILSIVASVLILRTAFALVRRSWHVLMEATPEDLNVGEIARSLEVLEGVEDIHHVHVWSLMPGKPLITLHAQVAAGHPHDRILAAIKAILADRFHITHSTVQIEGACADNPGDRSPDGAGGLDPDCGHTHKPQLAEPKLAASR
jgi:cobalt-zinc-cadmium efflux system protein